MLGLRMYSSTCYITLVQLVNGNDPLVFGVFGWLMVCFDVVVDALDRPGGTILGT